MTGVTGRVARDLREALGPLTKPLADAGFLVTGVHVVDEGTWGRLDATLEGSQTLGKLQIHLNKKGKLSIVPQGSGAPAIARALGLVASASPMSGSARSRPDTERATATVRAAPSTSRAKGNPGELVVDCSKFGQSLIGPTEWRGMLCEASGKWREVFHSPMFERGHNNLGEFLAIVDGCQRIERGEIVCTSLWSDSKTAISWLTKGKIKSKIDIQASCDGAFAAAVAEALAWIERTDRSRWTTLLHWWQVGRRGENPADFGRK